MAAVTARRAAAGAVCPARRVAPAVRPAHMIHTARVAPARMVAVKASEGGDFDTFLMDMANKFEKSENKPAIIGYSAAALGAFFFSEWLIHLPALDILLGFPIQLLGLAVTPYLAVKYVVDKGNVGADVSSAVNTIVSKLPGLENK